MVHRQITGVVFVCAGLLLASCGGKAGGPAKAVRADQPTASDALGATACTNPDEEVEPWVIDLSGDQRVALRAAMEKGVVLVSYDCKQLKLVRGCTVSGNYDYTGTGFNEDQFRLEDADSVKATLSGGAALAAKLDAEMKRGTKLDVAYAVVGESNTTLPSINRLQLRGGDACKSATHFVGTASLGAFAMRSSTDAQVAAAAEVFGQGASGASSSSSAHTSTSGKRVVCQRATSQDNAPLADCDIPLKLRLVPISEAKVAARPPSFRPPPSCPPGTVRSGVACITAAKAPSRVCKMGEAAACEEQCKRGSGASCSILGFMYEKAKGVTEDNAKALQFYEQGCQKRDLSGCTGLGFLYSKGQGVPADKTKAQTLFREACEKGNGRACSGIGHQLRLSNDIAGATTWFDKACLLGYARACFYAGAMITKQGKDMPRAFKMQDRACVGQDLRGCLAKAGMLSSGTGTAPDAGGAISLRDNALKELEKECDAKDAEACEALGDWYMGVYDKSVRKGEKAAQYYGYACSAGIDSVCMDLARLYEKGEGPYIKKDPKIAKGLYNAACVRGNIPEACAKAGVKPAGAPAPGKKPKR